MESLSIPETPGPQLADLLEESDLEIGTICLTHFYPDMQGHEKETINRLKGYFEGDVILAEDLMKLEL